MTNRILGRILLTIAVVGMVAAAYIYRDRLDTAALEQWVTSAGIAGPLVFMGIYALGTVLFLPGSVLTLAGGALFGPVAGTFYSLTGATLGAALAFLIARYLAQDWVARKASGRMKQLLDGVDAEGWKFIAFVRLVPLFPFNLLNYALGLTRIRLPHYILASYLFMLPGAFAYTYLGYVGRETAAGGEGLIQKALLALALLALVAFLPRLVRRLRAVPAPVLPTLNVSELRERLAEGDDVLVLDVRTAEEYRGALGHIAVAHNIPLAELAAREPELRAHLNHPIAVVCRTDRRSAQAVMQLRTAGYTQLLLVPGGMEAWNRDNLPVEH
ncbi:MAG TPA: VTT domain-containing protein [Burkholderiales bacterium]|nr:VTT domain-containing protein [Burkholderiales bacterium]